MAEEINTKERKKRFDKIFKENIMPAFKNQGFKRHSKTSKRLYKEFSNKLSVFVFFEYKSQFRFYDISAAYFDEEFGDIYDDNYVALAKPLKAEMSGDNEKELMQSLENWLLIMEERIFPFLNNHSSHESLLESDSFYIDREGAKELLERKS